MRWKPWWLWLAVFGLWLGLPTPGYSQNPPADTIDWRELKTDHFIIVYAESMTNAAGEPVACLCGPAEAEAYAAFVDDIYLRLAEIFEIELETPINLRLFPTEDSYYRVNPVAARLSGVIAHALDSGREIAIALPRTQNLSDEALHNNMRHELAHLFAAKLSESKLNAGFQEGIAQYVEQPTDQANYESALLRQAFEQGRLLPWADFADPKLVYSNPEVTYPQTLSVIAFLMDRYGFPAFIQFVQATATEPGYRSALETAYDKSADALEAEWLAYLPAYFEGRWRINVLYSYDLSRVARLVQGGAYTAAATELAEIIALLESTDQAETLAQANQLLSQAQAGQAAGTMADEARQALQSGDYEQAIATGNQAIAAYQQLGYLDRLPEIEFYIEQAANGQQALRRLERGERLLRSWRLLEAEDELRQAIIQLQSLGNYVAAQRGRALLTEAVRQQRLLAYVMLGTGLALLFFNGVRRLAHRFSASPLEVEFT